MIGAQRLIIVSGEEGAGKSTIVRALLPSTPYGARIDAEDIGHTNPCPMDDTFFALLRRSVPAPAAPAPAAPTTASWATAHSACHPAHGHLPSVMAFDRRGAADKVTIMPMTARVIRRSGLSVILAE